MNLNLLLAPIWLNKKFLLTWTHSHTTLMTETVQCDNWGTVGRFAAPWPSGQVDRSPPLQPYHTERPFFGPDTPTVGLVMLQPPKRGIGKRQSNTAGPQEAAVAHPLEKRPGSRPRSAWGKKCLQRSTHESWVASASRRQGIATRIVERVFQGFQWHVCTFRLARLERWASLSTGAMSRYPTGLQSEARRFGLTALTSPTLPSVLQSGATPNQRL